MNPRTWLGTRRATAGLSTRLLAAQTLVLLAAAASSWIVASIVAPGIFHEHLVRADIGHTPSEDAHVEDAFSSAFRLRDELLAAGSEVGPRCQPSAMPR